MTLKKKTLIYPSCYIPETISCYRSIDNSSGYLPDVYVQPFSLEPWKQLIVIEPREMKSGTLPH